jgi:GNAT superfamily N-acetyltransferase
MCEQVRILSSVDEPTRESVLAILRDYNLTNDPEFFLLRDQPEHAPRSIDLIAIDTAGRVVGGLFAETQFMWLRINLMAVEPEVRRRGVGRRLVEAAECEARSRGCTFAYVDTLSFQAPGFYDTLGYKTVGLLPNWDSHGNDKVLLVKDMRTIDEDRSNSHVD